jgi:hypothetical protein
MKPSAELHAAVDEMGRTVMETREQGLRRVEAARERQR